MYQIFSILYTINSDSLHVDLWSNSSRIKPNSLITRWMQFVRTNNLLKSTVSPKNYHTGGSFKFVWSKYEILQNFKQKLLSLSNHSSHLYGTVAQSFSCFQNLWKFCLKSRDQILKVLLKSRYLTNQVAIRTEVDTLNFTGHLVLTVDAVDKWNCKNYQQTI